MEATKQPRLQTKEGKKNLLLTSLVRLQTYHKWIGHSSFINGKRYVYNNVEDVVWMYGNTIFGDMAQINNLTLCYMMKTVSVEDTR